MKQINAMRQEKRRDPIGKEMRRAISTFRHVNKAAPLHPLSFII